MGASGSSSPSLWPGLFAEVGGGVELPWAFAPPNTKFRNRGGRLHKWRWLHKRCACVIFVCFAEIVVRNYRLLEGESVENQNNDYGTGISALMSKPGLRAYFLARPFARILSCSPFPSFPPSLSLVSRIFSPIYAPPPPPSFCLFFESEDPNVVQTRKPMVAPHHDRQVYH